MPEPIQIGDASIEPGSRKRIAIPVARLPTEAWLTLPVEVIHGRRSGTRLWLSAAVHGDEINGVEIIRRVVDRLDPATLRGTVIAVPIVNMFGYMAQDRYLPDRRDLNRCFPGSAKGSLASRLAYLFMQQIVRRCTHGIDLHTGSNHRKNLAQIRANLADPETRRCAEAFGTPVIIHARTRDGSLREAAARIGIPVLVYEAGEPLRFDEETIALATKGILRVMNALGMRKSKRKVLPRRSILIDTSTWVRARRSGILRLNTNLGQWVQKKDVLGVIGDPFGENERNVTAPCAGIVIGHTSNPLVNQGDAVVHLGEPETTPKPETSDTPA